MIVDMCYGENKGYVQKGIKMECRNCGNQFLTDSIGTENMQPDSC
ncbi:MAG: Fe-S-containing protein [Candidatus Hodarchaeales archaeon]